MAEGLTGSSLRSAPRALGTQSGRMLREARRLERAGFGGAANQVAAAAAQQKLGERPGFISADTEIERQKLQEQANREEAAIRSGMDSRQMLFRNMQSAAQGGLAGAAGAKQLASFRSRAAQLGVAPDRFESTATGKLGIDLRALSQTPAAGTVASTATPAVATTPAAPATTTPAAPARVGMIGDKPAADVLREMRSGGSDTPVAATGSMGDFISGVKALTAAGGRNLSRKAAVEELNRQRMSAGKPALKPKTVFDTLLAQDRSVSRRVAGPALPPTPAFGAAGPDLPPTPAFGAAGPDLPIGPALPRTPLPKPVAATAATAASAPAPAPIPVMTSPEERMERLKAQGVANVASQRERNIAANKAREERVAERIRKISVPDWQKGTALGSINRRFQEFSARSQQ